MVHRVWIRRMVLAGLASGCVSASSAQSGLPSTPPTSTATSPVAATTRSPRRAEVEYTGGLLRVTANNASLNQILREIGRQTGMKITGGVQDDRVFGSYGPATASQVLASLLDGTTSNILIVQNDQSGPAELILTPRHGEASPPNPNAEPLSDDNDAAQRQPEQSNPARFSPAQAGPGGPGPAQGGLQNGAPTPGVPAGIGGLPPSNGGQTGTPISGGANLGTTPGAFPGYGQTPPDATAQPNAAGAAGDAAQPASQNGVSTPQQIYEQLQKLRQQQPAPPQ